MTKHTFTHPDAAPDDHPGYMTRDGLEVRIYATDAGGKFSIHGAISYDGRWTNESWTAQGRVGFDCDAPTDLIDKPRPPVVREVWVNAYGDVLSKAPCPSKTLADRAACKGRTACIRVTWVDGEGLE